MDQYQLLDSGGGEKLEQFGEILLIRPCPQAIWRPRLAKKIWKDAHGRFCRDQEPRWEIFSPIPERWRMSIQNLQFYIKLTEFGHLGIFPEHAILWNLLQPSGHFLNLFAYSGGASLAAAQAGSKVTHVDAAKNMVKWAAENASMNGISSIRWIVEDARKYLARAIRRKESYDGILLDPPSFGRGKSKEVFKIERDLPSMLAQCREILSDHPSFVILSCHTPGFTPIVLKQILQDAFDGTIEAGELILKGPFDLPAGAYARWQP
ncbi:MAG: class I SAM-dependent methyltransferase [Chlamydiales bacterium]